MTTATVPETKEYTLTIPRAQYNRFADAFELDNTFFNRLNYEKDTVMFSVTETQRQRFAQFATELNREKKKTGHLYWITQMFLEENINTFMKG